MKKISIILVILITQFCVGQGMYKYEKEDRIDSKLFPEKALKLLEENVPEKAKRLRYYREYDSVRITYEAKFKFEGNRYSVEFSENGQLEDVEMKIKKRKIPDAVWKTIKTHMEAEYQSFRVKKIQRQYRNTARQNATKVLQDAFQKKTSVTHFYEIVFEVKTTESRYFIEATFDKKGVFQFAKTIIQGSYDHILY